MRTVFLFTSVCFLRYLNSVNMKGLENKLLGRQKVASCCRSQWGFCFVLGYLLFFLISIDLDLGKMLQTS